jgi:hypothetical protein
MNLRMQEMIKAGEAIDISDNPKEGADFILSEVIDEMDYCANDHWIWSIGRRRSDGVILASHTTKFYQATGFECLWLR